MATQNPTCIIAECENRQRSRGWCITHYSRWRKHGDPHTVGLRKAPKFAASECSLNGCGRVVIAKGLCSTHYERLRRTGTAGEAEIKAARRAIVDGRKMCGSCNEWKPLTEFNKHQHGAGGRDSRCRECQTLHNAQWRQSNRAYWREWLILNRSRANSHSHNRRARIRGAAYEFIDRDIVFQRDLFTCMLCLEPLDMNAAFPHVLSPSIDHVIPLSKGGDHLYSNVQAAHFGCNSGKCDRIS